MQTIEDAHKPIDRVVERMRSASAEMGKPVTCSKGCFACCLEPVLATRDEVMHLLEMLTEEQREEVAKKTRSWAVQARSSRLLLESPWPHIYFYRMFKLWCPLLKDGLCSVYERRPSACRLHMAVGNPKDCIDDNRRLHQTFLTCPEAAELAVASLGPGVSKNLGVWLAEILCGIDVPTVGIFEVRQVGEELVLSCEAES